MASPEKSGGIVEGYKKLNKYSAGIALGVAGLGALFAPALIAPALTWAAIDGAQIVGINSYQKWQEGRRLKTLKA